MGAINAAAAATVRDRHLTSRVVGLTVVGGTTVVTVAAAGGAQDLVVPAVPDADQATRLTAGFRRLAWVRLHATGDGWRCEVSGVARRPRSQRLPVSAALALIEGGTPAVVHLRRDA